MVRSRHAGTWIFPNRIAHRGSDHSGHLRDCHPELSAQQDCSQRSLGRVFDPDDQYGSGHLQYNLSHHRLCRDSEHAGGAGQQGRRARPTRASWIGSWDVPPSFARRADTTSSSTNTSGVPISTYSVWGTPVTLGVTGYRGFCSDNMNPVLYDPNGGTNCTMPLQ